MSARTRASSSGGVQLYERMIWDILSATDISPGVVVDTFGLVPVIIPETMTINTLGCVVDTLGVAPGNLRMGIYRDNGDAPTGGALVVEGGPQALVASKNEVPIVATQLTQGLYWIATLTDDALTVFTRTQNPILQGGTLQSWEAALAFAALPALCPVTAIDRVPIGYVMVASVP